ncbi:hypothetical protein EST38_g9373 [Candolleomyces aberdarensis]|uniref:Uncharacterized protein n=1 Tax=Candolleomyces aberdarensis TaxID=2316362 RepID=A0A4Q2DCA4_9AGAR|nr:hypothetical protein EST38_g9373 [Candolleomyces aberdarensis]
MASSDQDTAPIEPSKETLETESKATNTDVDIKPKDDSAAEPIVDEPKPATDVEGGGDPIYSEDDDEFPKFGAGKPRGKINQPVSGGSRPPPRPPRPVKRTEDEVLNPTQTTTDG